MTTKPKPPDIQIVCDKCYAPAGTCWCRWIYALVILAIVVTAVVVGTLAGKARGEWFDFNPPGSVNGRGIHPETKSRCPQYGWRQVAGVDPATQCHEATHFINGAISNELGQRYGAFYVGGGVCFVVREPKVTVGVAARYVPQDKRTPRYQQYLTGERESRNGLSIIDELVCYTNDAQCVREMRLRDDGGRKYATEFHVYADALLAAIRQHDPSYVDLGELQSFIALQKQRVAGGSQPIQIQPQQQLRGPAVYASQGGPDRIMELPMVWRERNRSGSCVFVSTANQLRHLGMVNAAKELRRRYSGGGWPSRLREALDGLGIKYAMTTDGDRRLLDYASQSGRGAGIAYYGKHYVNFVGWDKGDALLLGNHNLDEYHRIPESEFLWKWRNYYMGWACVILDGDVPPLLPGSLAAK